MNWAGSAFAAAQTSFQLGSDIMKYTADYLNSKMKESQLKASERNYRKTADYYLKLMGVTQESGRMSREMRMIQLGQDIGNIATSAAGSGIDVSSRIVRKTSTDTARSAYNDAARLAENEKLSADDQMNQRLQAIDNALWSGYAAKIERHNRKLGVVGGALTTTAHFLSGVAGTAGVLAT